VSLLRWTTGERKDRDALRSFACTEQRSKIKRPWGGYDSHHPAPYELRVQSMIRENLKPAGEPGRTTLLGWDTHGSLGGVSTYRSIGSAAQFSIDAIAVASRFRHKGGGCALEAISTTLDYLTAEADAHGYSVMTVAATIHEDNRPSQHLFERQGFEQTDEQPHGYQVWSADIVVEGAAFD
jgi:RimJ/RimL family protein N-acetyltransferase